MTSYFTRHEGKDGNEVSTYHSTAKQVFEWLGEYHVEHDKYPSKLLVFEAVCILDAS